MPGCAGPSPMGCQMDGGFFFQSRFLLPSCALAFNHAEAAFNHAEVAFPHAEAAFPHAESAFHHVME